MPLKNLVTLLLVVTGLFACKRGEPQTLATPPQDEIRGVVDSIFPIEEDIRRFRAARGGVSATELANADTSRAALVDRFMRALEDRDTAELRAMVITPAEFIDIYYPSSIYVKPPYKQSPELVWFLMQQSSEQGIKRALDRYGGLAEVSSAIRLFGPIMERDGRFKFLSYANDL